MKSCLVLALALSSLSAFAGTQLSCQSANYAVSLVTNSSGVPQSANYAVNKTENVNSKVKIGAIYSSNNIIAFSLNVDGKAKKFEVAVTNSGANQFTGKIFAGAYVQNLKCTQSYVVTPDDRDDDADVNR